MEKLTDKQIEQAAKAACQVRVTETVRWLTLSNDSRDAYREMMRAAAPYLQVPWEPPTKEEIGDAERVIAGKFMLSTALIRFVQTRNAALDEKP